MARHDRIAALTLAAAAVGAGWMMHPAAATATGNTAPVWMQEQRLATINVFQVVEKMVQSDRYKPAREAMMKEFQDKLDAPKRELESLVKDIVASGQDSEKGKALIPQYQARKREADQLEQELQGKAAEFNTQQLGEAYRIVVETANQLAEKGGYTHVIASRGVAAEPLHSTNVAAAVQEILARPMVKFPAADDLTEAVAKELKVDMIKTESDAPAPGAADQQPAPAPAPAGEPAPAQPK